MAGRILERRKRRLPCEVRAGGQQWSGMVLDVSPSGLFVQTGAKVGPGDSLELDLFCTTVFYVTNTHPGNAGIVSQDLFQDGIPLDRDITACGLLQNLLLQDFLRPQFVTPVNQGHLGGDV